MWLQRGQKKVLARVSANEYDENDSGESDVSEWTPFSGKQKSKVSSVRKIKNQQGSPHKSSKGKRVSEDDNDDHFFLCWEVDITLTLQNLYFDEGLPCATSDLENESQK